jgi:hypothetical protein
MKRFWKTFFEDALGTFLEMLGTFAKRCWELSKKDPRKFPKNVLEYFFKDVLGTFAKRRWELCKKTLGTFANVSGNSLAKLNLTSLCFFSFVYKSSRKLTKLHFVIAIG